MNIIFEQIGNNLSFINSVSALWNKLDEHYSKLDGHKIYQVTNDIINHKQNNTAIELYYHKLKGLWDELDALEAPYACLCRCDCVNGRTNGEREQRKRLIQLLMGLDESYTNVRGQILLMQPLSLVSKAYSMLRQEEKQKDTKFPLMNTPTALNTIGNHRNFSSTSRQFTPNNHIRQLGKAHSKRGFTVQIAAKKVILVKNAIRLLDTLLAIRPSPSQQGHDGTLTIGKLLGGLYALTPTPKSSVSSFVSSTSAISTSSSTSYLWHARLGHPSFQFQTPIQTVRSDNGTEFLNESLSTFFQTKGIINQTSCPYTPQQNARVERKHRQLLEMVRSLFFQAKFPLHLWGYCILTSTYLINRLPSKVLNNKSPYECLYIKAPDLTHLRIIGCQALVYTPTTDKFAPKAIPTVHIGYPPHQKGYLLYNPITEKTITSRNVTFNETIFPFHTDPSPTPNTDPTTSPLQYSLEPQFPNPNTPLPHPTAPQTPEHTPTPPTPPFNHSPEPIP
ncbi:cysteine-rich receptor-like protein kinase 8 [Tanacetum coccineum]